MGKNIDRPILVKEGAHTRSNSSFHERGLACSRLSVQSKRSQSSVTRRLRPNQDIRDGPITEQTKEEPDEYTQEVNKANQEFEQLMVQ